MIFDRLSAFEDAAARPAASRPAESYTRCAQVEAEHWEAMESAGVRSWADCFERSVARHAKRIAVIEVAGGRSYSYEELDRAADRVTAWAVAQGEAAVALRKENGFAFLAGAIGLAKAGVLAVLINTREPADRAARLALSAGATTVLGEPIPGLKAAPSLESLLAAAHPGRVPGAARSNVQLDDPCWIIFTSGTSGGSKAAQFSHRRMIGAGIAWSLRAGLTQEDRCYNTLPLYHGNALAVAFSACVTVGAASVLRERFSVRAFLEDIRTYGCTAAVYIGELWRYLDRSPAAADDACSPLRVVFGNGLSADIWLRTVERFGISHVVEHYGATELPAAALTNWTNRAGFCGYVPPGHPDEADIAIVDSANRRVGFGIVGELVLRIKSGAYHGYVNPADNAKKVTRGLFEPGDLWWRSGDLLRRDEQGFFTFVERVGDGFRWKGENVAAVEVEEVIRRTDLVKEVAVYGVSLPHHDGKAGMASLVVKSAGAVPDLDFLHAHLHNSLPAYAVPRFLWVRWDEHPTTATFKIVKAALAAEAFNGTKGRYILDDGRYQPLTTNRLEALFAGRRSLV